MSRRICYSVAAAAPLALAFSSASGAVFFFSDPSGLAAEAEFILVNPTTISIRLKNTSTGVPMGATAADQLLTGISFDLGMVGVNMADPTITGGTAVIGATSVSVNFSTGSYGPGTNIGGEWGFGNAGGTGILTNSVSGNTAGVAAFGGPNLDGSPGLNGPQAGLVATPHPISLGGLGAIENEIDITITLSAAIANLDFLTENGMIVEYGSDAAFVRWVPAPASCAMLLGAPLAFTRRRR